MALRAQSGFGTSGGEFGNYMVVFERDGSFTMVTARSHASARQKASRLVKGKGSATVYALVGPTRKMKRIGTVANPAARHGTVRDIPSTWTPAKVKRVGRGIQIRMRGK